MSTIRKTVSPGFSTDSQTGARRAQREGARRIIALACRHRYAMLSLLCLALYLPAIFTIPTIDRDEGYFAEASRQMLASGDFVIPHYLKQPHRKPPAIYWLEALSAKAFGARNQNKIWPYRVPSVAGAAAAALLTCWTASMLFDEEVGLLAGAMLAASLLTVVQADLARADAVLLACVMLAQSCLAALYCGIAGEHRRNLYSTGFWIAIALGVLVKGPVLPFIAAATVGSLYLASVYRRARDLNDLSLLMKKICWPWAMILAAAVVAGWVVAVLLSADSRTYLAAMSRDLLPKLETGVESHAAPPGYYLLLLPVMFWPGSLFLATAAAKVWRTAAASAEVRFCLAWLLPIWIASELLPTKLPHYVLPAYPAVAILTAWAVLQWRDAPRWIEWFEAIVWTLLTLGLGVAVIALLVLLRRPIDAPAIIFVSGLALSALVCAGLVVKGRLQWAAWISIAAAVVIFGWVRVVIAPGLDELWLSRRVAAAIDRLGIESVAAVGYEEPSLMFALGPRIFEPDPTTAVDFLDGPRGRALLITGEYEPAFLTLRASKRNQVCPVWRYRGFDYSKGQWLWLTLYQRVSAAQRNPCVGKPNSPAMTAR